MAQAFAQAVAESFFACSVMARRLTFKQAEADLVPRESVSAVVVSVPQAVRLAGAAADVVTATGIPSGRNDSTRMNTSVTWSRPL